jgi:hypothetical protein
MPKYCTGARWAGSLTQSCCERHDADYAPGSGVSRAEADRRLLVCIASNGYPWRACAFFIACRLFGWIRIKQ